MNPQQAWTTAFNQLEVQLDRANFDTWLRDAVFLGFEQSGVADMPSVFRIGVPNSFAVDMLQHRLYRTVRRIVSDAFGQAVEIRFEVSKRVRQLEPADNTDMPLFQLLAQREQQSAFMPESEQVNMPPVPVHTHIARPKPAEIPDTELNPNYTFERFVSGNANNMVYSAAQAVAENPANQYNPFVIHGGVGLGKSHLLQAIAHHCRSKNLQVIYISSEAFINDLVNAIRQRTTAMFRDRYRSVDVLIVDDIQFIAGKESTQEEFFHTFNALHTFNKQIVLASDRHPREMTLLEDRLRSRFEGGLIMDVQPPEFEARVAIIEMWAQERDVQISRSVSEMIAGYEPSSIRNLNGIVTKVIMQAQLSGQPITLGFVESVLHHNEQPRYHRFGQVRIITVEQVIQHTAQYYKVDAKDIAGRKRKGRINHARQMCMYLARELTEASLPDIGKTLGRSHTTVLHGYNKIAEMLDEDAPLRYEVNALRDQILAGEDA